MGLCQIVCLPEAIFVIKLLELNTNLFWSTAKNQNKFKPEYKNEEQ